MSALLHDDEVPELPPPQSMPTKDEDGELNPIIRLIIRNVGDARQFNVVNSLLLLEKQDTVQHEVLGDLLARLEHLETAFQTIELLIQPTIEAVNTLRVDVDKLFEQQR